jgi:site-specific DNA recombinase
MIPMHVYTYARYSTDRQSEESIVDQQRRCHTYARGGNWPVTCDFIDEGISGAALGNRPGLAAALRALTSGDVLLVVDLTRLSRSQDLAPLLERLRYQGIRVVGVLDGFDSASPHARMQAGLSGLMSDEFRASIRARTHSALEMRAREGRPTGGRAYGYDGAGRVIETEAAIVREIFERTAAGGAMRTIASDLNRRGIPSPGAKWRRRERRRDGRWVVSSINAILRNERYVGRRVWNRWEWLKDPDSGKRTRRRRSPEEQINTECPAIVDAKTWAIVAARASERGKGESAARHRPRRYLLSGLLVCEHCGNRMVVTGSRGSHYACATHRQAGPTACPVSQHARRDLAEDAVLGPIRRELLAPEAVELACGLIRAAIKTELLRSVQGVEPPEVATIERQIIELEDLIAAHHALAATLRPVVAGLREKVANVQRAHWRKAHAVKIAELPAEEAYKAAVADMASVLGGSNVEAARAAVRSLTGDIPIFQREGKLYGRLAVNAAPLFSRCNPRLIEQVGSGGRI